eukprot:scaffold633_cov321-Pavlova_lutheri.AAC.29
MRVARVSCASSTPPPRPALLPRPWPLPLRRGRGSFRRFLPRLRASASASLRRRRRVLAFRHDPGHPLGEGKLLSDRSGIPRGSKRAGTPLSSRVRWGGDLQGSSQGQPRGCGQGSGPPSLTPDPHLNLHFSKRSKDTHRGIRGSLHIQRDEEEERKGMKRSSGSKRGKHGVWVVERVPRKAHSWVVTLPLSI